MAATLLQMTGPVMDIVYRVRALPQSGQEAVVTGFEMSPGGGFNALVAARAAGMDAALGGSLGTGPLASVVRAALAEHGISLARAPLDGHDQGCCTVLLEPDGERSFVAWPGAEGEITAQALALIDLAPISWVMLSGYTLHYPGARAALVDWLRALPQGVSLLFDPSPMVAELPDAVLNPVLARADWISANDSEARVLLDRQGRDCADERSMAAALAEGREGAVLRLGARGSILSSLGATEVLPVHPVTPLDTNGAGDCHIGSFIAELSQSGDALRAARYANIAAALSTTRAGPATPPARDEVLARL